MLDDGANNRFFEEEQLWLFTGGCQIQFDNGELLSIAWDSNNHYNSFGNVDLRLTDSFWTYDPIYADMRVFENQEIADVKIKWNWMNIDSASGKQRIDYPEEILIKIATGDFFQLAIISFDSSDEDYNKVSNFTYSIANDILFSINNRYEIADYDGETKK